MDKQYEYQRDMAESELERQIDNWQALMELDECATGWVEYIQRVNLEYQMENEDARTNPR